VHRSTLERGATMTTTLTKTWVIAKGWLGYFVIGTAIEVLLTIILFWLRGIR
jgi:hypothetical protein